MKFSMRIYLMVFILILFVGRVPALSQNDALAAADTSYFSVNHSGGWLLYNSRAHVNESSDSAELEIIIQHDITINLQEYQFVGTIKGGAFRPVSSQLVTLDLITHSYVVRIDSDGRCYVKLQSGILPPGNAVVIPVQVTYRIKE